MLHPWKTANSHTCIGKVPSTALLALQQQQQCCKEQTLRS
jgi:hypothetical protein